MEMKITHGDNLLVALKGRLDTVTSAEFSSKMADEEITEEVVIIDMKELEYISSAGLRALVALKKTLFAANKSLEVYNLNPVCQEVFKVTGFNNIIRVK